MATNVRHTLYNLSDLSYDWKWASGEPIAYLGWSKGEPIDNSNTDCAFARLDTGTWETGNCGNNRHFICEYNANKRPIIPNSFNPDLLGGWCPSDSYKIGNDCFTVFDSEVSFEEAQQICKEQNGRDLASFSSQAQIDYLINKLDCNTNKLSHDQVDIYVKNCAGKSHIFL